MVHCVVAHAVAAPFHLLKQFGVARHIITHHEESGLYSIVVEGVEHPRGHFRYGAVIEGEEYHLLPMFLKPPYGFGKQSAVDYRWLLNQHGYLWLAVSYCFMK